MEICIVGAGKFGSALAEHFSRNNFKTHLVNKKASWPKLSSNSAVILCTPTQSLPDLIEQRKNDLSGSRHIISGCKGLLKDSLQIPTDFLKSCLGTKPSFTALSGPSFSDELKQGLPSALVLANSSTKISSNLCRKLSKGSIRFYISEDPVGVQWCGALKNSYAFLAGLCEGLELGENARAALTTRALSEISQIVQKMNGDPLTTMGLAGAGDLFLTCSSHKSRNFQFGYLFSKNKNSSALIKKLGTVEGFETTFVAAQIARNKKLNTPLLFTAELLLKNKISFKSAFEYLMNRKPRKEIDL